MLRSQFHQVVHRSRSAMQAQQVSSRRASSRGVLPRLPVPDLHQTLQRYLKSLEPFLLEDEASGALSFDVAYGERREWAEDFEKGIGKVCQERLRELDKRSPHNWLDDNIWLKKAYHEWRSPLLINSNWWLSFVNDPNIPEHILLGTGEKYIIPGTGVTRWQVRRAAWLLHRTLEFKMKLERQEVHPDTTREGLWFRRTASQVFNTSRIPQPSCDAFSVVPPATEPSARAVVICVHDWFYAVEAFSQDLRLIPVKELERRILKVVYDAGRRTRRGLTAVPISVLGADHRDRWAKNLKYLLSLSPDNHDTLAAINHSLVALSLDDHTYVRPSHPKDARHSIPAPDSPEEVDDHLHNLRSSHPNYPGRNRWWDKPLNYIVEPNTRAGAIGEHSPCDALVPSILTEYAVVQAIDDADFDGSICTETSELIPDVVDSVGWRALEWVTDEHIKKQCSEAGARARLLVEDSDDSVLWFNAYGAEWIKTEARQSPDAFIQMALQLAWYRTRGSFTATYETALTRLFHHGRTETIRALTTDSRAFVLAMTDPSSAPESRHKLLLRAIQTHTNLTRAAATGKGIDRHLLGLRLMLEPSQGHPLFDDELFSRSQTWKLSTSGLSSGHLFRGTGFGASESDGYGINYLAGPQVIKFGIESKHSSASTSTDMFKSTVRQALLDMRSLFSFNRANL